MPAADAAALADAIAALDDDRPRLTAMSAAALVRSREFGLDEQARLLDAAVTGVRRPS